MVIQDWSVVTPSRDYWTAAAMATLGSHVVSNWDSFGEYIS